MAAKIVLATRLPEEIDVTARAAAKLASSVGAEIVLVYVAVELSTVPSISTATGEDEREVRERMLSEIDQKLDAYMRRNMPEARARVRIEEGEVATRITDAASEEGADYVVIGTEGRRTMREIILGSTSQAVLRRATCPVLVVPARPPQD